MAEPGLKATAATVLVGHNLHTRDVVVDVQVAIKLVFTQRWTYPALGLSVTMDIK